ncbi:MAG: glycine zipper domain-containing protein, partial [Candidatus Eremiobacterota bacterium]
MLPAIGAGLLIGGLISLFSGRSQESQYSQQAGQGSNHLLGTLLGGAGGAVAGSMIMPGVGTVIGGILGALFGRELSKQFSGNQCQPQPQQGCFPPPCQGG